MTTRRWLGSFGVLGSASLFVAAITAVAKIASVSKDILVAQLFGTGVALEAFLNGFIVPSLVAGVVTSAIASAFTPCYVGVSSTAGAARAAAFLRSALVVVMLGSSGIALALFSARNAVLSPIVSSLDAGRASGVMSAYATLLAVIPLSAVSAIGNAALASAGRYSLSVLNQALVPLTTIALLTSVAFEPSTSPLVTGTVLGFGAQMLLALFHARKLGLSAPPTLDVRGPETLQFLRLLGPAALASLIMTSSVAIDQAMANMLSAGNVASLSYGSKAVLMVTSILPVSLATVLTPRLSRLAAERRWVDLQELLRSAATVAAVASLVVTLALISFSEPLIRVAFQHGAFVKEDVGRVALVQSVLALQLPAYSVGSVYVAALTALRQQAAFVYINIGVVLLNVVLNYLLMFRFGAAGIALSTVLVYCFSFLAVRTTALSRIRALVTHRAG